MPLCEAPPITRTCARAAGSKLVLLSMGRGGQVWSLDLRTMTYTHHGAPRGGAQR